MKTYLVLFFISALLIPEMATSQVSKNPCLNSSLTRKSYRESALNRSKMLYDFKPKERIASVGAGGGSNEIIYSMTADSLIFYLQDIDSTCLIESTLRLTLSQLYSVSGQTCTAKFISVIGTEEDTKLPDGLDKVITENTLHELAYPEKTLLGIRKSLKSDGFLFVQDFVARKPGQRHRGCKKVLYTEEALIDLLDKSGFRLVESNDTYPSNKDHRTYKFSLK